VVRIPPAPPVAVPVDVAEPELVLVPVLVLVLEADVVLVPVPVLVAAHHTQTRTQMIPRETQQTRHWLADSHNPNGSLPEDVLVDVAELVSDPGHV
jgi:hypothetical protein